jgi:SP family facilitated glucose transporter-like MFS transporter 8
MLGSMSFGLTITFWSPAADEMSTALDLLEMMSAIFNVLASVGAILGGILANLLSKVGCKLPLFGTGIVHLVGWVAIGITGTDFLVLVFVMGTVVGVTTRVFSSICLLHITELAPAEVSGIFGTFNQLGVMAGSTLTYLLGVFIGWRVLSLCLAVPSFILCFAIWFVVESLGEAMWGRRRSVAWSRHCLSLCWRF